MCGKRIDQNTFRYINLYSFSFLSSDCIKIVFQTETFDNSTLLWYNIPVPQVFYFFV